MKADAYKVRNNLAWRTKKRKKTITADGVRWYKTLEQGKNRQTGAPIEPTRKKVERMYRVLSKGGWVFTFKTEAVSPRGFRYHGEGSTADTSFLRAFKMTGFSEIIPKIPKILRSAKRAAPASVVAIEVPEAKASECAAIPAPDLTERPRATRLGVCRTCMKSFVPRGMPSAARKWRRLYMRAYRYRGKEPAKPEDIISPVRPMPMVLPAATYGVAKARASRRIYMRKYRTKQYAEAA